MNLTQFAVGDTWSQQDALADYPASAGWVLKTRFVYDGAGTAFTLSSTASGDDHVTTAAAAVTATWTAGTCTWVQYVELGAVQITIGSGKIVLQPNPRTASTALDLRSAAQVGLDAVRAVLRGTASAGVLSYSIAGRTLQRYSIAELIALESKLAADVVAEQRAAAMASGQGDRSKVYVRLGRA